MFGFSPGSAGSTRPSEALISLLFSTFELDSDVYFANLKGSLAEVNKVLWI